MRVLVTGGGGFIGSHLVDVLIQKGHYVLVIDNMSTGNPRNLNVNAEYVNLDIQNKEILKVFERFKPDVVYHLAAQVSVKKSIEIPRDDADSNIMGIISVLEGCKISNVQKIIYSSSAAVYGDPLNIPIDESHPCSPISFYGISKKTPEDYIGVYSSIYGIKFSILRYSNVFGPRQNSAGEGGVISTFKELFDKGGRPFIDGSGVQTRDFIYVKDVAEANLEVLNRGDNEVFNVSSGNATSIIELFHEFKLLYRSDCEPQFRPERVGDIKFSVLDNSKIRLHVGWKPRYSLRQGLLEYIHEEGAPNYLRNGGVVVGGD